MPSGNTVKLWRGDPSFTGANAVEKWSFSFDDPTLPATTMVTDPLGKLATYTIGRDTVSDKPRITADRGRLPELRARPQRAALLRRRRQSPAAHADDRRPRDDHGLHLQRQRPARLEDRGDGHAARAHHHLGVRRPVPGPGDPDRAALHSGTGVRATVYAYDGVGNPTAGRSAASRPAAPSATPTTTTYNGAGRPLSVDPPGYGTPGRDQLHLRSGAGQPVPPDPHRSARRHHRLLLRSPSTGPRPRPTRTASRRRRPTTPLNRVLSVIQKGATPAEDLVTDRTSTTLSAIFSAPRSPAATSSNTAMTPPAGWSPWSASPTPRRPASARSTPSTAPATTRARRCSAGTARPG